MGVVIKGKWLLQDPLCNGYSALEAYLPSQKIAISLVVTFVEGAFNTTTGSYPNEAVPIFEQIGAKLAPSDPAGHRLPEIRLRRPAAKAFVACSSPALGRLDELTAQISHETSPAGKVIVAGAASASVEAL